MIYIKKILELEVEFGSANWNLSSIKSCLFGNSELEHFKSVKLVCNSKPLFLQFTTLNLRIAVDQGKNLQVKLTIRYELRT